MSPPGLRVAYLVSRYPAVSHTFVRREIAALRRRGVDVHTFSVRRPGDDEVRSIADRAERDRTIYLLPAAPARLAAAHARMAMRRPAAYARTLSLAQRHRPTGPRAALWATFHFAEAVLLADELARTGIGHLHAHFANAGGNVAFLATRLLGIGFSQTLHGHADFNGPMEPLIGEKIAAARFTACVSEFGRGEARRRCDPADRDRVRVVRCGIELDRFDMRVASPAAPPFRVVCVGRLSPEKGHVVLLRAFASLAKHRPDVELVLVGEGPERGRIEAEIAGLGLGARVLLRGALPERAVREELERAHVFALSSFVEGLPVVLMEAMASGVPVVAPRITGIPELVEHERSGLLFSAGSAGELEAALDRLLGDAELRERLARQGRAKVEREFDIDRTVEPLVTAFREALGSEPAARSAPSTGAESPARTGVQRTADPRRGNGVPGDAGR